MSYLTSDEITSIQAQIVTKQAQLDAANDALTNNMGDGAKSYSLDTGDGKIKIDRKDDLALERLIDRLERKIDSLNRKLNGKTNIRANVRRIQ